MYSKLHKYTYVVQHARGCIEFELPALPSSFPFKQMEKPREVGEDVRREDSRRFQQVLGVLAKVRHGSHVEQVLCAACDIVDKHLAW